MTDTANTFFSLPAPPCIELPPDLQRGLSEWPEAELAWRLRYSTAPPRPYPQVAVLLAARTGKTPASPQATWQKIQRYQREVDREVAAGLIAPPRLVPEAAS